MKDSRKPSATTRATPPRRRVRTLPTHRSLVPPRAPLGLIALCLMGLAAQPVVARDLQASIGDIANMTDSSDAGPFVELVKAIDAGYAGGSITRKVFPFERSIENVITGRADFHIPVLRDPKINPDSLPYRFVSEKLGVVSFVLYSHVDRPLTSELIHERLRDASASPYVIEVLAGAPAEAFDFPIRFARGAKAIEQSMQRAAAQRIDAFLVPQEEGDRVLRQLKLKDVHRALCVAFDDVIAIPKGPAGDEVDAILSETLRSLKAKGAWTRLYHRVHQPYDDWQPARQN
jgi:polar amino acid transport system substrate-binding protein